ncbi:phosphatase PAP2 family protein [Paenibacillus sp. CC-CFT747]|nr:phosphatase PAP2 family protein [Paenibacillus sp. CC-CFT747]
MGRMLQWLLGQEQAVFRWVNRRRQVPFIDIFFSKITHLGGATATILVTLALVLFAEQPWRKAGLISLIALAVSHLPVAAIKKKYPRLRPYLVLPGTATGENPLTDHSFPSGHSTAIFAAVIPFVLVSPALGFLLIPLALLVAYSRMYLGLHYPSDCLAGALLGTMTAVIVYILS